MQKLEQEHVECLQLADRLDGIVQRDDSAELATTVQWLRDYNIRELEPHLQHEEQTLFIPLLEQKQQVALCIQLGKEHGLLRTLVENLSETDAREDLAEFAQVLRNHTLLEDKQLFPALEGVLTPEQWETVRDFKPLGKQPIPDARASRRSSASRAGWLDEVDAHFQGKSRSNGHLVLFPRYQPELIKQLAEHLNLSFLDFRREIMADLREQADQLGLEQMMQILRERSQQRGLVCHNAEALLACKPEAERRAWLQQFVAADWPHLVVIPLTLFQADAPDESAQICDLELVRLPRQGEGRIELAEPLPY